MILQTSAFLLILALFILRAPTALRRSTARPAWFASGFAILGLLTLGMLVPIPVLDRLVGGMNLWNLGEALAATASFWYFRRALQLLDNPHSAHRAPWGLLALLVAITVPFCTIDLGPTDVDFVDNNLTQPGLFVYLFVYLAGLAVIAGRSAWIVRRRWKSVFSVFIAGYALVTFAAILDIAYITTGFFRLGTHDFQHMFFNLFNAFFYPGVFLLAVGFTSVYTARWLTRAQPLWRVRTLALHGIYLRMSGRPITPSLLRALSGGEPVAGAYDEVVKIRDLSFLENIVLTRREAKIVASIESAIAARGGLALPAMTP